MTASAPPDVQPTHTARKRRRWLVAAVVVAALVAAAAWIATSGPGDAPPLVLWARVVGSTGMIGVGEAPRRFDAYGDPRLTPAGDPDLADWSSSTKSPRVVGGHGRTSRVILERGAPHELWPFSLLPRRPPHPNRIAFNPPVRYWPLPLDRQGPDGRTWRAFVRAGPLLCDLEPDARLVGGWDVQRGSDAATATELRADGTIDAASATGRWGLVSGVLVLDFTAGPTPLRKVDTVIVSDDGTSFEGIRGTGWTEVDVRGRRIR